MFTMRNSYLNRRKSNSNLCVMAPSLKNPDNEVPQVYLIHFLEEKGQRMPKRHNRCSRARKEITEMTANNMATLVEEYIENDVGLAWDMLWEYLQYEGRGKTFSQLKKRQKIFLTKVLNIYLRDFGMGRRGKMNNANPFILAEKLHEEDGLNALKFFENLPSRVLEIQEVRNFNTHVAGIQDILIESGYSGSLLLVSKLLLGLTGKVPAYDQYFKKFLKSVAIRPAEFSGKSYNSLIAWLGESAPKGWLRVCRAKHKKTRLSEGSKVPDMRILDIVGWQYGYKKLEEKRKKLK